MNPFMLKNPYKMHKYTTKINGALSPKTTPPKMFCLDASLRGGIVLIRWENFDAGLSLLRDPDVKLEKPFSGILLTEVYV